MSEKKKENWMVQELRKLKNDLKPMTFKQKCEHIWEYYREWLIFVVLGFMAISLVTTMLVEQRKEYLVSGMMVNIYIDGEGMNYLTRDYAEYLGAKNKYQVADMDYANFGDPLDPETGEASYYQSMILPSRVTGAMLDYMILDKYAMKYYITHDVYMDLRDFFTEEELAQLAEENRVIYAQEEGSFDRCPIAVVITDLPFIQEYVTVTDDIYFALSGSSPRPEMCRNVWEYLHAWEKPQE